MGDGGACVSCYRDSPLEQVSSCSRCCWSHFIEWTYLSPVTLSLPDKSWKLHPSPETCSLLQDLYFQEMLERLWPLLNSWWLTETRCKNLTPLPHTIYHHVSRTPHLIGCHFCDLWEKIMNNSHLTWLKGENKCSRCICRTHIQLNGGNLGQISHSSYS